MRHALLGAGFGILICAPYCIITLALLAEIKP